MEFAPKINAQDFRCFWSTPVAWGNFAFSPRGLTLSAAAGAVSLNEVMIGHVNPVDSSPHSAAGRFKVMSGSHEIAYKVSPEDGGVRIQFTSSVVVDAGNALQIVAQ
jgi:hypothetical protein